MLKVLQCRGWLFSKKLPNNFSKRYFLSEAYQCREAWENRLNSSLLKKVDHDNLYFHLDQSFQLNRRISILDVDLFVNTVRNTEIKNDLEEIIFKVRMCPECAILPERTSHAVIRWYMDNISKEDLLNLLSDRLSFGMFPSHYLTNLLLDKYLKKNDAVSAVKIAVLQMLQEDFDHPIMKLLSLYSCFNYLDSSDVWETPKKSEPDPDEEVTKVRVEYVRNFYFDDHFDITDTNHLVGKSLLLLGESLDNPLGTSSQLVGLVLFEKYDKCVQFLEKVIKNNKQLFDDALVRAKEYTMKKPKQVEKGSEEDVKVKGEENIENKSKLMKLLDMIQQSNLIEGNLLKESEKNLKAEVEKNEGKDIETQCKLYSEWEKERENHLQYEIERSKVENVKHEIEKTKEELEKEEEKLFFFDREEEMELKLVKKEEVMSKISLHKAKIKKKTEQKYVPPEIGKKN